MWFYLVLKVFNVNIAIPSFFSNKLISATLTNLIKLPAWQDTISCFCKLQCIMGESSVSVVPHWLIIFVWLGCEITISSGDISYQCNCRSAGPLMLFVLQHLKVNVMFLYFREWEDWLQWICCDDGKTAEPGPWGIGTGFLHVWQGWGWLYWWARLI